MSELRHPSEPTNGTPQEETLTAAAPRSGQPSEPLEASTRAGATPAAVHIRVATLDDLAYIVRFNQCLALESEGKVLDEVILTRGVRRALSSPDACRYFVAELQGRVVGQTMLTYELTDWRDGLFWWIQSVYVEADCRGRGIFSSLYHHIEGLAKADPEVRGLRLYVEPHNDPALRTYERLGMHDASYKVLEVVW
ncbi:MAG: N-acetyltransferase family protein [Myxococcota bacterium]